MKFCKHFLVNHVIMGLEPNIPLFIPLCPLAKRVVKFFPKVADSLIDQPVVREAQPIFTRSMTHFSI